MERTATEALKYDVEDPDYERNFATHTHSELIEVIRGLVSKMQRKCENCFGTGEQPDSYDISSKTPITRCHKCNGTGYKTHDSRLENETIPE